MNTDNNKLVRFRNMLTLYRAQKHLPEDSQNPDLTTTIAVAYLSRSCSILIAAAMFASVTFIAPIFKLSCRLLRAKETDGNEHREAWLSGGCINSCLCFGLRLVDVMKSYVSRLLKLAGLHTSHGRDMLLQKDGTSHGQLDVERKGLPYTPSRPCLLLKDFIYNSGSYKKDIMGNSKMYLKNSLSQQKCFLKSASLLNATNLGRHEHVTNSKGIDKNQLKLSSKSQNHSSVKVIQQFEQNLNSSTGDGIFSRKYSNISSSRRHGMRDKLVSLDDNRRHSARKMANDKSVSSSSMMNDKGVSSSKMLNDKSVSSSKMLNDKSVSSSKMLNDKSVSSSKMLNDKSVSSSKMLNDKSVSSSSMINDKSVSSSKNNQNQQHKSHVIFSQKRFTRSKGRVLPTEVPIEVSDTESITDKYRVHIINSTDSKKALESWRHAVSTSDRGSTVDDSVGCERVCHAIPRTSYTDAGPSLSTDTMFSFEENVPDAGLTSSITVEVSCKIPLHIRSTSVHTLAPKQTGRSSVSSSKTYRKCNSLICSSASLNKVLGPSCKIARKRQMTHDSVTLFSYSMEMLHKCIQGSISQYGQSANALSPCFYEEKKSGKRYYLDSGRLGKTRKQRRITYRQCSAARQSKQGVPTFVLHPRTAHVVSGNSSTGSRRQQQCCTTSLRCSTVPYSENGLHTLHRPHAGLCDCSDELKLLIQTTITDMQKYNPIQATSDKIEFKSCHHSPYVTLPSSDFTHASDLDNGQTGKQCSGKFTFGAGYSEDTLLSKHSEHDSGFISSRIHVCSYCNNVPAKNKMKQTIVCVANCTDNTKNNKHARGLQNKMPSSRHQAEQTRLDYYEANVNAPFGTKLNHTHPGYRNNQIPCKCGLQDTVRKPSKQRLVKGAGLVGSRPSHVSRCCADILCSSEPSGQSMKQARRTICNQKQYDCVNAFFTPSDSTRDNRNQYNSHISHPQVYQNSKVSKIASKPREQYIMSNNKIQVDQSDNLACSMSRVQHLNPGRSCSTNSSMLEAEVSKTTYRSHGPHAVEKPHRHQDLEILPVRPLSADFSMDAMSRSQCTDFTVAHKYISDDDSISSYVINRDVTDNKRLSGKRRKCSCDKTTLKTRKQLKVKPNSREKPTYTLRESLSDKLVCNWQPRKSGKFVSHTESSHVSRGYMYLLPKQPDVRTAQQAMATACYTSSWGNQEVTPVDITRHMDSLCSTIPCDINTISDGIIFMKCRNNSSESAITNSTRCTSAASVYLAQVISSASTQTPYITSDQPRDKCVLVLGKPDTCGKLPGQEEKNHLYYHIETKPVSLHPVSRYEENSPPSESLYSGSSPLSVCKFDSKSPLSEFQSGGHSSPSVMQYDGESSFPMFPYGENIVPSVKYGGYILPSVKYCGNILPSVEYSGHTVWPSCKRRIVETKQSTRVHPSHEDVGGTRCQLCDCKRLNCYVLKNNNFPADETREVADKGSCQQAESTLQRKGHVRFKQSFEELDNEERNRTVTDVNTTACRDILKRTHGIHNVRNLRDGDKTESSSDVCTERTISTRSKESSTSPLASGTAVYAETTRSNMRQTVHVRSDSHTTNTHNIAPSEIRLGCNRHLAGGIMSPSPIALDGEQVSYLEIIPKNGIFPGFRLSELDTARMSKVGTLLHHNNTREHVKQPHRDGRADFNTNTPSLSSSVSHVLYAFKPASSISLSSVLPSASDTYPSTLTGATNTSVLLSSEESDYSTQLRSAHVLMTATPRRLTNEVRSDRHVCVQHQIPAVRDNPRSAGHACSILHNKIPLSSIATTGHICETGHCGTKLRPEGNTSQDSEAARSNNDLMLVGCRSVDSKDKSTGNTLDKQVSCNIQDEMVDKEAQTSTYLSEQDKMCFNMNKHAYRKFSQIPLRYSQKNTLQKYLSSSENKEVSQETLNKVPGDCLSRTADTTVNKQLLIETSKQKEDEDPRIADNKRQIKPAVREDAPDNDDESGLMFKLQVNDNPNHTSHIRFEKRCSNKDGSGVLIRDLIQTLKILAPYSKTDLNANDCQTGCLDRQLESSFWDFIKSKRSDLKEKSVQCTQTMTVRPKLNDILRRDKNDKQNNLTHNTSCSKNGSKITLTQSKHAVSPGKQRMFTSVKSNISSVSLSYAAGRIIKSKLDTVREDNEDINNDAVSPRESGKMLKFQLCNKKLASGEPRIYKKPRLKCTQNENRQTQLLLKAKKCKQTRGKLSVKPLTLSEGHKLESTNKIDNLSSNTQTMPPSKTRANNSTLKSKILPIAKIPDRNTPKHHPVLTEGRRHVSVTPKTNCFLANNVTVTLSHTPPLKSRIPVPINHTNKFSVHSRIHQQKVHCLNMRTTPIASSNISPNCSIDYGYANHDTQLLPNRKIKLSREYRVCNSNGQLVVSPKNRVHSSQNKPFLSEKTLPRTNQDIFSKNNLNCAGRIAPREHQDTCKLGLTETCVLTSQMVDAYRSSNNCQQPAKVCSNHTFTKDTQRQIKAGRSKSTPLRQTAIQEEDPAKTGETRLDATTLSTSRNPNGNKTIRKYVGTQEDRTGGRTLHDNIRFACNKLHISSKDKVKSTQLYRCNINQQPDKTSHGTKIGLHRHNFQQIHADYYNNRNTSWGVDSTMTVRCQANMFRDRKQMPANVVDTKKIDANKASVSNHVPAGAVVVQQKMTDNDLKKVVSHQILDLSILPSPVYKRNCFGLCSDLESDCYCCVDMDHREENCTQYNIVRTYDTSITKSGGKELHTDSNSQKCHFSAHQLSKQVQKLNIIQDIKTKIPQESLGMNTCILHDFSTKDIPPQDISINSLWRSSPENEAKPQAQITCPTNDYVNLSSVSSEISNTRSTSNTLSWICISTTDDVSASYVFDFPSDSRSQHAQS